MFGTAHRRRYRDLGLRKEHGDSATDAIVAFVDFYGSGGSGERLARGFRRGADWPSWQGGLQRERPAWRV